MYRAALFFLLFFAYAPLQTRAQTMVDHIVFAAPDLAEGVRVIEELLGVTAVPGGQHIGIGTRNSLMSLGNNVYLEIIGPDPEQPEPEGPRPFGIDTISGPRLVTWAARATDLGHLLARAQGKGVDLGEVGAMSREKPDGTVLSWKFSDPFLPRAGGVVPFIIAWGDSQHPAETLPPSCELLKLQVQHPDPEMIRRVLLALEIEVEVNEAAAPGMVATIRSPNGIVELR